MGMLDGIDSVITGPSAAEINLPAEQRVLAALLSQPRAFDQVGGFLRAAHFSDELHGRIFAAIADAAERGQVADAVTLAPRFPGDVGYLGSLLAAYVGPGTAAPYAVVVRDAWLRREALGIAQSISDGARGGEDPAGLVAAAVDQLLGLGEAARGGAGATRTLGDAVLATLDRADKAMRPAGRAGRLDTGLPPLDGLLGGLWPGQLYFLAARSRTGKTPLMMQIGRGVGEQLRDEAARTGALPGCVHVLSLEMTAADLGAINLAAVTDWSADQVQAGHKPGRDFGDLLKARTALAGLPVVIDDPSEMTIADLGVRARVVKRTHRTRLLLIDYMELVGRPPDAQRMQLTEWVPALGYRLKALAKALDVPILALRQINKRLDDQEGVRPSLRDLPYDGGQAADAVLALHRPELTMPDEMPDLAGRGGRGEEQRRAAEQAYHLKRESLRGVAEIGTLKRRFGPTGWERLRFDGPRMTFSEPGNQGTPGYSDDGPDLWRGS